MVAVFVALGILMAAGAAMIAPAWHSDIQIGLSMIAGVGSVTSFGIAAILHRLGPRQ